MLSLAANAVEIDAEKERIRQEVVLATPELNLIDDLIQIRMNREVLSKQRASQKIAPESAVTLSSGREHSLGYEYTPRNSAHGFRVEFNWLDPDSMNSMFDGAIYSEKIHPRSLGAYHVLRPFGNGLRFLTGVRLNDIKTLYVVNPGSSTNINGNHVTLSQQDNLIYRFTYPRVTPYLGIGFVTQNIDDEGLAFFGEIGATFGRYNAQAATSINTSLNIDSKQIDRELSALKEDRFSKRYSWIAKLGLRYSY